MAEQSRSLDADAQIPQSVVDEAEDVLEEEKNYLHIANCIDVIGGQTCCGMSRVPACDRFPCSRLNGEDRGNCTWYVCARYGGVPFTGDAHRWWGQVPDHPGGWGRGTTPRWHRNIAWWNINQTMPRGHVGFIESYWGGTPTIREMNYCSTEGTCIRIRGVNQALPHGYIFELTGGPDPTTSTIAPMHYDDGMPQLN
jgi:hypothetical protein